MCRGGPAKLLRHMQELVPHVLLACGIRLAHRENELRAREQRINLSEGGLDRERSVLEGIVAFDVAGQAAKLASSHKPSSSVH